MKHSWKIFYIFAGFLLVLAVIWVAMMPSVRDQEVNAYKKSLIARGEKLEIEEVLPPPVPPEQNGADLVTEAHALLPSWEDDFTNIAQAMTMVAPGEALICFEQPDVRNPYSYCFTNSWSNVVAAMEFCRPATKLLRQAMNYPALDFHSNYIPDFQIFYSGGMNWGPTTLENCANRLLTEAVCDLRRGDSGSAATNVCAILGLVNGEHCELLLYVPFERATLTSIAAAASWELLQSTDVNDADLVMLEKYWQRLEYVHAMENTILMERAQDEFTIGKMRVSGNYFNHVFGFEHSPGLSSDWEDDRYVLERTYAKPMWHFSWTYSDELRMLQSDQIFLDGIRTIETNGYFNPTYTNLATRLPALTNEDGSDFYIVRWPFSIHSDYLGRDYFERTMASETTRSITIAAIALKRYRVKHGVYPAKLNSLVPEFLAAVPRDPVDGLPLRYRLKANGTFLLYSVGLNGKDDGGNPALGENIEERHFFWLNPQASDWVWPQPATAEDIAYFNAHPPK